MYKKILKEEVSTTGSIAGYTVPLGHKSKFINNNPLKNCLRNGYTLVKIKPKK